MFESDDYDQALSQIDFPDHSIISFKGFHDRNHHENSQENVIPDLKILNSTEKNNVLHENAVPKDSKNNENESVSPKHTKRKIISSHFDQKSKRKFPGPAGLLTGLKEETEDEQIYQIELLSQDVDYSHNHIINIVLETSLWKRLIDDTMNYSGVNTIKAIKQQALAGHLQQKKAHIVRAFVEAIDRSAVDPLITLRDATGHIKCTLHRDAWTWFSTYIISQYCALVICKPTVLTTGSAFKKHYLNITLSNISAIYSSTIIKDEEQLPDGFTKTCEEDFTIIKINNNFSGVDQSPDDSKKQDNLAFTDELDNFFDDVF